MMFDGSSMILVGFIPIFYVASFLISFPGQW